MVEKEKVVVFMKGVPEAPQCGFSNAVCTFCLLCFYHEQNICWGVAKCVHEIGRNQKIEPPHFRFKWCFLCSGGLNMMILDQIIQKKTKTTTKQPKTSTHCFWFLWTGQGTFLVQDFHRPNGAKILRFGNFPETLTYLGSLENCQKSKSFSKIGLWKSWNFGYFSDRTRISEKTTPLSIHLGSYDHDGGYVWSKKLSNLILV